MNCHRCRLEIERGQIVERHEVRKYVNGRLVTIHAISHEKCLRRCEQQRAQGKDYGEPK